MTQGWVRLLLLVVISVSLSACNKATVRDDDAGATGDLGSPLVGPSPADVYIDLSAVYLQEGNLSEALTNAKKAVIVDPRSSNAHYVLALVYQRLGQMKAAGESFRKAVSVGPRNPVALNAYGSYLCKQKNYEEADKYFRRALANPLYSTPWLAWHNAGHCNELAGATGKAESDYRGALRTNPRFGPSLLGMAKLSFQGGNYLSARAYLQRYGEVAKHTPESLWLGVRTENQLGDKDQMASYSLKLKARYPDSEEAKFLQSIE
ncbi:type IV pilus biogenesis/stability protein PilW [Thiosocius teredinicola]|uniref:type IV pilus biogenesis/stability protein PilW n=1 Tax=Thiosocius teredinicola TaxID=1973002 RepID=UPI0013DDF6F9